MSRKRWLTIASAVAVAVLALLGYASFGVTIADTEEDIWPDPRDRQGVHLSRLDLRLQNYFREHGALPAALGAVGQGGEITDLWGTPIQYEPHDSTFVLRSAGPDRQFGTRDDLAGETGVTYASKRRLYLRARDSAGIP